MVAIRNINDIILGLIDFFKSAQPDLDTKPGTVARDLFIEAPASQLSLIYDELANVSSLQSMILTNGANLDKLAQNFGLFRNKATPSNGTALLTFNSIDAPFAIKQDDLVMTRSGYSFKVTSPVVLTPSSINLYKSIATKFKNDLDYVGIADQYAVQVFVQSSSPGSSGNIAKYSLSKCTTSGITGAVNVTSFSGGSDQESDSSFRNRILSLFNGSSIGTALGYKNLALSTDSVSDAIVVEPGDSLMTRDGTEVSVASDGTRTIVSEGNGGKVDVIILGENIIKSFDTFIYQDKSNSNDPSSDKNDYIIGQISGDENKTINKRRLDNIKNLSVPSQPVSDILSVSGSLSGANFKPKTIDSLGRVFGNYELVKDSGEYSGSPWGFDKFKWISNKITNFSEDLPKKEVNSQEQVSFTDLISSSKAEQNILIFNENSKLTSDRSIIQLLHYPATNVSRVYNVNTNERYLIVDQNVDSTGLVNKTGRVKVSGNTLPLATDVLQVDYTWVFDYDPYVDYDGKYLQDNIREVTDSVDWGYSSRVKDERTLFTFDSVSNVYSATVTHPINSIVSCNSPIQAEGVTYTIQSGINFGRKAVLVNYLQEKIQSITNCYLKNTFTELYNTSEGDGKFSTSISTPLGGLYQGSVILPTDTLAEDGDVCVFYLNPKNAYAENCSFASNKIIIPKENITDITLSENEKIYLNVSYISKMSSLTTSAISTLPLSKSGNNFISSNLGANGNIFNLLKSEDLLIKINNYSQYYVEINANINNFTFTNKDIVLAIRKSDYAILKGTVATGSSKYRIVFDNSVTLAINDQVTVFYYLNSLTKNQPFTYQNNRLLSRVNQVEIADGDYYIPIFSFIQNSSPITFRVIDPTYKKSIGNEITTGTINPFNDDGYANLTFTDTVAEYNIPDITFFKIEISDPNNFNNNGVYDILSYNQSTKNFKISYSFKHLNKNQISVFKVSKNKELWNKNCIIDIDNNKFIIKNDDVFLGDKVFVNLFSYKNLRKSPTNLSSIISDQNISSGSVLVEGVTLTKLEDIVFTCNLDATSNNIKIDFTDTILKSKKYSSILPSLKLARVVKLEKVITAGANSDEVLSTVVSYNLKNSKINDNSLYVEDFIEDYSLGRFEIVLPPTTINSSTSSSANNLPKMGDKLRATLYIANTSDSESLNYTSSGTLYSNKKFAIINKISSSGFNSSSSSVLNLGNMNQPTIGSRYKIYYDYLAPKKNERITIDYNYNKAIADVTFNIEKNRPINADVIVKQANKILVNLTMNIVIEPSLINSSAIIAQNVKDAIISNINLNSLGATIDSSDLINAAYTISGVDRARIIYFNKNGSLGQALSLIAQNNEYFSANNIIVNTETR